MEENMLAYGSSSNIVNDTRCSITLSPKENNGPCKLYRCIKHGLIPSCTALHCSWIKITIALPVPFQVQECLIADPLLHMFALFPNAWASRSTARNARG